jgi:homoserine O-acetyltransferase
MRTNQVLGILVALAATGWLHAADYPESTTADYVLRDFRFAGGDTLPEVRIHYRTLGTPRRDETGVVRNAVLLLHGTGGSGDSLVGKGTQGEKLFVDVLLGKGQPLDVSRYYLIVPDNLGHGRSSKSSDGLRGRFPHYRYRDMIEAQYRLLTDGLKVNHLRLVLGTSMGGMHAWLWGETHPDFVDALMPLASLPAQISGRNRMWRRTAIDAIRTDPAWKDGDYKEQPHGLKIAVEVMTLMSRNPVLWQQAAPTLRKADDEFDKAVTARLAPADANDLLYALESSADYDPGPGLEKIRAPLLAVNTADDLINPPELGILERGIKRVKRGKAVVIPAGEETIGHGTHTKAVVWKQYLEELLKDSERRGPDAPKPKP